MNVAVCTLFEKRYHYGVAALINSLYKNGYKGSLYAGYKGSLPEWCDAAKKNSSLSWHNATTLEVAEGLQVHFLPMETEFHLTFYKPYFMADLLETVAGAGDGIVYFDPDIVVKCKWAFFENWVGHGVALVHESLDRPANHPIRREWEKVVTTINKNCVRELDTYINGGFCGVSKNNIEFLQTWREVIEAGKQYYNLNPNKWGQTRDRTYLFYNADQDTLNVTAMCSTSPLSEVGPEGMDFIPGGFIMSHALGKSKPWNKRFIRSALKGVGPTLADRAFWENSRGPLLLYSKTFLKIKGLKILTAAFISRFYRRS